jgi:Uncharacterized conserved protein (DUF2285)
MWRPEFIPTAVIIAPSPRGFRSTAKRDAFAISRTLADRANRDGRHLILDDPDGDHRLWLLPRADKETPVVVIPLDADFADRVAGASRFRRWLNGKPSGAPPRALRLTERHRVRLVLMLRAFDMRAGNATYREIAAALFGNEIAAEHGWKTLPVRGRTIRLVQDATEMIGGGYLKLLRGD